MNKNFYLIIFFLFSLKVTAQNNSCNYSLSGKIIDEHDRSPLSFAMVYIIELKSGASSDVDGNYSIENICDGTYTLRITHLGCEPLTQKVRIKGNTKKDFSPEHHSEELRSITITGQRSDEIHSPKNEVLSGKQFEEARGRSLGEALKTIAGVSSLQTGSSISKPVIHGMHSNRILILNNGVRQEGQQWGSEHAPEIDPFVAGRLSVIKGAASVRYGSDAMAGVIIVEPLPLRDSAGIGGELNLVGFSNGKQGTASGILDGKLKNKFAPLNWRIQGTFKQGGNTRSPGYYLENTGSKEYNFSYMLGWHKENYGGEIFYSQFNTNLGIFAGSHIGNLTDLYNAFSNTQPLLNASFSFKINRPYQHIEHELFKCNLYRRTGDLGKLTATYSRQYNLRNEFDSDEPAKDSTTGLDIPDLQLEITTHTGDLIWEHNRIKSLTGSLGISGMRQGNTYEGRYFIPNFKNINGGVFWIEKLKGYGYEMELGVRYDYKQLQIFKYERTGTVFTLVSPVRYFQNISGTMGAIYKPDSIFNVSYNFGTAWRTPGVNELYSEGLHHGSASIEYGYQSLVPEKAFNSILSLNYIPLKMLSVGVSGYYNYIQDYIYLKPELPAALTIQGAFPTFRYQQTNSTFKGIDATIVFNPVPSLEISAKASFLRAWNLKDKSWLIQIPSDRYQADVSTYFKDNKYFSGSYCTVGGQFITKQWRVPVNGDYVSPPVQYFLLNLESGITLSLKSQKVKIGFGVNNLLNKTYRDYMDRFRYYTDAMGRNYTLRIKIPFNAPFRRKHGNYSSGYPQ